MRLICVLFIMIVAGKAYGFEARVLIDEEAKTKTLGGEIRLRCLQSASQPCPKKTYLLPAGQWLFARQGGALKVKSAETGAHMAVVGEHFRMTGSFNLDGKLLRRVDLVFEKEKTNWIAFLPIDQYLFGVMAAEVPASWPLEALKAQAVASRTYFLFKKMKRREESFDVRSDILDQVFSMDAKKHRSIIQAVTETHGMVLISKNNNQIFPAYFHSDCGGKTSSENLVWRKPTSLNQAVPDPVCKTASKNNWTFSIDKAELLGLLQSVFYLPSGADLDSVLPRIHQKSRAYIVDFLFSEKIVKRISANELRRLLGYGKLKSTRFSVHSYWDKVVFTGRGFGHGVGLCQWGAQRWARKGRGYREILSHYYPQANLEKMDPENYKSMQARLGF